MFTVKIHTNFNTIIILSLEKNPITLAFTAAEARAAAAAVATFPSGFHAATAFLSPSVVSSFFVSPSFFSSSPSSLACKI